jgi:pimeloyl-ACP methyl ester carboxylesterase
VRALVFVAAFQPDVGEAAGALNERFPGTQLIPDNLVVTPNPLGGDDLTLQPGRFAKVYAADLDPGVAAFMAASQRPVEPAALGQTFDGEPKWRSIPSWALISTADRSLPPAILRFMAERAGSHVVEVDASHAVPVSRPGEVADLVAAALASVLSATADN